MKSEVQQFHVGCPRREPRMRKIFNSKSPPKVRTCADSRRNFWTTGNLKTAVCILPCVWYDLEGMGTDYCNSEWNNASA